MNADEMIRILEEIIRDPDTNATARCTAIRTCGSLGSRRQQKEIRSPIWKWTCR
jgi:hypothetical protein